MRLAALAGALPLLAGCATLQPTLGWYCNAEATAGPIRTHGFRYLDHAGRLRDARTEWFYKPSNDSVDAQARWSGGAPIADYRTATIILRHFIKPPAERGQLVVYSDRGRLAAPMSHASIRSIDLNGAQLMSLRGVDQTFGIHTYNPRGELMGGSGIEWRVFDEALDAVQQIDARTRAMAADFARQCEREQRIILT